ncbi:MAG: exodeoxyribonuclease V subunit alpha [Amphritea sp.]
MSKRLLQDLRDLRLISALDYQFACFIQQQEMVLEVEPGIKSAAESGSGLIDDLFADQSTDSCNAGDEEGELLGLLAALTSYQLGCGEVCLPLNSIEQLYQEWPGEIKQAVLQQLSRRDLPTFLIDRYSTIGGADREAPLTLFNGRLYLRRYWCYENFIAQRIRQLSQPVSFLAEKVATGLQQLFPDNQSQQIDWQKVAVAVALSRRFSVISGGPGTGKTTTVTRLLGLFVELSRQQGIMPVIKLAAPTGKAAARLSESIAAAREKLSLSQDVITLIPDQATTLHRLLGTVPNSKQFRHHADNPLHLDLLVVDEASMIDLPMMTRLLDALPDQARLILIGDKDQLASVEAGSVLGDICAWDQFSPGGELTYQTPQAEYLARVCQIPASQVAGGRSDVADSLALLRYSYRFDADSGIGQLARAINQGNPQAIAPLFQQGYGDIEFSALSIDSYQQLLAQTATSYSGYLGLVNTGATPDEVLQAYSEVQLLAVLREGVYGVEGLNEAVEKQLSKGGLINREGPWYPGRPVMISRNDYQMGLYNGDIGIALEDNEGTLRVWFEQAEGPARGVLPSRLPAHETVYAMTVHKSQGSEFSHVLMILPAEDSPLLTRELVYTGVTRAKQRFSLYCKLSTLQSSVKRRTERASGLAERLWQDL